MGNQANSTRPLREMLRYLHCITMHAGREVGRFEERFPGLAIQTFDCQIGERINKLVKQESAPLAG